MIYVNIKILYNNLKYHCDSLYCIINCILQIQPKLINHVIIILKEKQQKHNESNSKEQNSCNIMNFDLIMNQKDWWHHDHHNVHNFFTTSSGNESNINNHYPQREKECYISQSKIQMLDRLNG